MADPSPPLTGAGTVTTEWPVAGLSRVMRHITGHNVEGKSVFVSTDYGDHHRVIGEKQAIGNIIYSTNVTPIELNDDIDIKYAKENEPGLSVHNGSVARLIDFGPGAESPLRRSVSLGYAIFIGGVFKLLLDSGEERTLRPGDTTVQRATAHQWVNVTGNGLLPGRLLFVLLDVNDVYVDDKKMGATSAQSPKTTSAAKCAERSMEVQKDRALPMTTTVSLWNYWSSVFYHWL